MRRPHLDQDDVHADGGGDGGGGNERQVIRRHEMGRRADPLQLLHRGHISVQNNLHGSQEERYYTDCGSRPMCYREGTLTIVPARRLSDVWATAARAIIMCVMCAENHPNRAQNRERGEVCVHHQPSPHRSPFRMMCYISNTAAAVRTSIYRGLVSAQDNTGKVAGTAPHRTAQDVTGSDTAGCERV